MENKALKLAREAMQAIDTALKSSELVKVDTLSCPDDVYETAINAYAKANENGSCPDHCVAMACEVVWKAAQYPVDNEVILQLMQDTFVESYKSSYFKNPQASHTTAIEDVFMAIRPYLPTSEPVKGDMCKIHPRYSTYPFCPDCLTEKEKAAPNQVKVDGCPENNFIYHKEGCLLMDGDHMEKCSCQGLPTSAGR